MILAPTVGAEFDGSGLPAGWTSTLWAGGPGGSTVGRRRRSSSTARCWRPMTATGLAARSSSTPPSAPTTFQHAGFGVDLNSGGPLGHVQHRQHDRHAVCPHQQRRRRDRRSRSARGSSARRTGIASNGRAAEVRFFVDGVLEHTETIAITADMRPIASDFTAGGPAVSVDWLRMSPYASSGTFTSRVLDAGVLAEWQTAGGDRHDPGGHDDRLRGTDRRHDEPRTTGHGRRSPRWPMAATSQACRATRSTGRRCPRTDPDIDPGARARSRSAMSPPPPARPSSAARDGRRRRHRHRGPADPGLICRHRPGATVRANWTTVPTAGLVPGQDYDTASGNLIFAPGDTEEFVHDHRAWRQPRRTRRPVRQPNGCSSSCPRPSTAPSDPDSSAPSPTASSPTTTRPRSSRRHRHRHRRPRRHRRTPHPGPALGTVGTDRHHELDDHRHHRPGPRRGLPDGETGTITFAPSDTEEARSPSPSSATPSTNPASSSAPNGSSSACPHPPTPSSAPDSSAPSPTASSPTTTNRVAPVLSERAMVAAFCDQGRRAACRGLPPPVRAPHET